MTVTEDLEFQAIFVEDEPDEEPEQGSESSGENDEQVTLTLQSSHSAVNAPTGGGTYDKGTTVRIEAVESAEDASFSTYTFQKWSDGSTERVRDIVVNSDMTLTAEYYFQEMF